VTDFILDLEKTNGSIIFKLYGCLRLYGDMYVLSNVKLYKGFHKLSSNLEYVPYN